MNQIVKPRIAIFLRGEKEDPRTPRTSALTVEVIERLRESGATVDLVVPENEVVDIRGVRPLHDLYVLREKTALNLSVAAILALAGARIVNSVRSCMIARDKIAATSLLAAAGIPVPPSWTTGNAARLKSVFGNQAMWLKPQRGSRGFGVRRIENSDELRDQQVVDAYGLPLPIFAQREVPSEGQDVKVYVVGEKAWALKRVYPAMTMAEKLGTPFEVPRPIREAALACGRALGLELYGVDFLISDGQFYVVDVNAFPGYKGIEAAPGAIAEFLSGQAQMSFYHGETAEMPL